MALNSRDLVAAVLAISLFVVSVPVLAGGSGDDHDDDALRYFGFVKDANGRPIAGAQVSAALKGSVTLSAITDATGAFRIPVPRILPGVSPENIAVSCARAGYKQSRTVIRSNLNQKPLVAVEIECLMQGAPTK